jgi:hypothetical protein
LEGGHDVRGHSLAHFISLVSILKQLSCASQEFQIELRDEGWSC